MCRNYINELKKERNIQNQTKHQHLLVKERGNENCWMWVFKEKMFIKPNYVFGMSQGISLFNQ